MRFVVFFVIWFSLLGLGYAYVGWRIIAGAQLRGRKKALAWVGVALALFIPQVPFIMLMNRVEASWVDVWFWPGYIVLGMFSLLLFFFLLRDIVILVARGMNSLRRLAKHRRRTGDPSTPDPERRRFLVHSTNLGIAGIAGVAAGYGLYEAYRRADIEEVAVPIPHLPVEFDGFRIVQFSDIHVGPTIKRGFVERTVEQIGRLRGDMIAFTGDLVDGSVRWLREDVAPLKELAAPHGVFFVTGNHEYYSGVNEWVEEADRIGFTVLLNDHRLVERDNAKILLAGVTDPTGNDFNPRHVSDPAAALAGAPEGIVRILLAHQPKSIFAAAHAGFDLQLSGHTHGGQFFPWDYMARLSQPYIKGLHKHGATFIYVSRGTGYWGPPMRVGIPPEITVITLRRPEEQAASSTS